VRKGFRKSPDPSRPGTKPVLQPQKTLMNFKPSSLMPLQDDLNISQASTIKQPNQNYLRINRDNFKKQKVKFDPQNYFYLASYSADTFIDND
jgi:hypothetical protein